VATGGLRWCDLQGGQRGSTPLLSTQLCLARPSPKAPRRARAAIPIRLCNLPDAFVSTTRLRRPPVRLHRGAHSPGAGKPAAQLVRTSRGIADTVWSCGIRIGFFVGGRRGEVTLVRRTAEDGLFPGLARLPSALAASSFLLGLVSAAAAAAAATTLGAARALAAPAGGPRRVRDRRRPRLIHSFLPQTFV
jgi:hypothetical protein